jgi:hypothetical protein
MFQRKAERALIEISSPYEKAMSYMRRPEFLAA